MKPECGAQGYFPRGATRVANPTSVWTVASGDRSGEKETARVSTKCLCAHLSLAPLTLEQAVKGALESKLPEADARDWGEGCR